MAQFQPFCNNCSSDIDASSLFTSCGHFHCKNCTPPSGTVTCCLQCNRECDSIPIEHPHFPENIRDYISSDAVNLLSKVHDICKFQQDHYRTVIRHLRSQVSHAERSAAEWKQRFAQLNEEHQSLAVQKLRQPLLSPSPTVAAPASPRLLTGAQSPFHRRNSVLFAQDHQRQNNMSPFAKNSSLDLQRQTNASPFAKSLSQGQQQRQSNVSPFVKGSFANNAVLRESQRSRLLAPSPSAVQPSNAVGQPIMHSQVAEQPSHGLVHSSTNKESMRRLLTATPTRSRRALQLPSSSTGAPLPQQHTASVSQSQIPRSVPQPHTLQPVTQAPSPLTSVIHFKSVSPRISASVPSSPVSISPLDSAQMLGLPLKRSRPLSRNSSQAKQDPSTPSPKKKPPPPPLLPSRGSSEALFNKLKPGQG